MLTCSINIMELATFKSQSWHICQVSTVIHCDRHVMPGGGEINRNII